MNGLNKLFFLEKDDLKSLFPFFILFLLLYIMLSLGEGISLSLFITKIGALKLPKFYGLSALFSIFFVGIYFNVVDKISNTKIFYGLIFSSMAVYMLAWGFLHFSHTSLLWIGTILLVKELTYVLFIVHFGNYLLDFFCIKDLNRFLPLIYSGGRIGGILGGFILSTMSHLFGVLNLMILYYALGITAIILLSKIYKKHSKKIEAASRLSINLKQFFNFLINSPFLILVCVNTFLFILLRTFINFNYNLFFSHYFHSDVEMAEFLGIYTIISLSISLGLQMFFLSRIVNFIGLKGAHFLYNILLGIVTVLSFFKMTLWSASFSRFVENELRLGYRTTIMNLIGNKFEKSVRAKSRAFSLGFIVPISTLCASILLETLDKNLLVSFLPFFLLVACMLYVYASFKLYHHLE